MSINIEGFFDEETIKRPLTEEEQLESKKISYAIKNILLFVNETRMLKKYNTEDTYLEFLRYICVLLKEDPAFLLYADKETIKILEIININKYKFKTKGNVRKIENSIIVSINTLNNAPDKEELRNEYIEIQSESRMTNFKTNQELKCSIGFDILFIQALFNNNNLDEIDDNMFLKSTSYLLDDCILLYKYNREFVDKTIARLNKIKKNYSILDKRKIKIIKRQLKKETKKD